MSRLMWILVYVSLALLAVPSLHGAGLTDCPDCGKDVSQRAVMCPHCGCPGEAIAEAVAQKEAADAAEPVPGPVVRVTASAGNGYGIAVNIGERQYLVMDARLLWEADSLTITPSTTNSPIAYRDLQLGKEVPLARFRTDATNLTFLTVAQTTGKAAEELRWMLPCKKSDGHFLLAITGANVTSLPGLAGKPPPVAVVNAHTNLLGVAFHTADHMYGHALPGRDEWVDAAPGVLRAQTHLLTKADRELTAGRLTPDTRQQLTDTEWLTNPLQIRAESITQRREKE